MDIKKELLEQFEYSLPVIKSSIEELHIETSEAYHGEIMFRNVGGSMLEGSIASNLPALSFLPENFMGNRVVIKFTFDIDIYKQGDVIKTQIVVMSNGGELIIPVTIVITTRSFFVNEETMLNSLEDFRDFARDYPPEAARIFSLKNFSDWLVSMRCEHMELYEHFKFDANKERAIDNFLFLQGLKNKAVISLVESESNISVSPDSKDAIAGVIGLSRRGWGFVEADIYAKNREPWLNLVTTKISQYSFNQDGMCEIDYIINPKFLGGARVFETVCIKSLGVPELCHSIYVKLEPFLKVRLNKLSYAFYDTGHVSLENNTGSDLVVEIFPHHDFIGFKGRKYLISAKVDIPFEIKLTPARLSQLNLKNNLVIKSFITVKAGFNGLIYNRVHSIGITDLKGYV